MIATMVTYGSPEMVELDVQFTTDTIKTSRKPHPTAVPCGTECGMPVYEVPLDDVYTISVGGERVHTVRVPANDNGGTAFTIETLPDGTRHAYTEDGLFAMTQGKAGTRVTVRDDAQWSRFGWVVDGDRIGWSIGSGVFDSRRVVEPAR